MASCTQADLSTDYRLFSTGGYVQFIHREKSLLFVKITRTDALREVKTVGLLNTDGVFSSEIDNSN